MKFKPLAALEPLGLPIGDKTYEIQPVDFETGLLVQHITEVAAKVRVGEQVDAEDLALLELDDEEERDLSRRLLGAAYDEMRADRVPWEAVKLATRTVFVWTVQDLAAAQRVWEAGGVPEASRPTPQDHKAPATQKASSRGGRKAAPRPRTARPASPSSSNPRDGAPASGSGSSSIGS